MPSVTYPLTQTAIIQDSNGNLHISHDVALPELKPGMILVRAVTVAVNPVDYKMAENLPSPGAIGSCDFASVILEIGSEAAESHSFKVGQRVCGAVHGSNPIDLISGSFAQYVAMIADLLLLLLGGIAPATVGLALYPSLKLTATPEEPAKDPFYVLVYGGSTTTGTMAIRLLKHIGVDAVFDYNSPTCVDDIRAYTKKSLRHALDTMTDLYPEFGHTRQTVKPEMLMGLAIGGGKIALDRGYQSDPNPQFRKFGKRWFRTIQGLSDDGKIIPHPIKLVPGKFEGILEGLEILERRGVSGEKMVVSIE
ncbi:putative zinc-binding dehydrogenase family oxidoreductase [Bisporella sp. PMI_857]|nr:putative zinc-binding dehydrogenase family oxidoreductase [Bisporella sp. PMI_857]